MATIRQQDFIDSIADSLQYISYYHPADYIKALGAAYEREQSPAAKDAMALRGPPVSVAKWRALPRVAAGFARAETASVTGTGSFWVWSVAPPADPPCPLPPTESFTRAFEARHGRAPDAWAAAGYDAAAMIAASSISASEQPRP